MTKSIDFYFDFISPYSYLAYKKLKPLNQNNEININYKPILLGGLHKLGGITAPAFNKRKMKNMKNDCELVAIKNNINFKWNTKFPIDSLYLMRGYLVIENQLQKKFFDICFDAYWKDNIDISNEKDLNKILERVGLNKREHHYPNQLSGGEQQRVAIARAFACAAKILFADEPTGNLDPKNGRLVSDLLFEVNSETDNALIIVTHDHELAEKCDKQIDLKLGKIVE